MREGLAGCDVVVMLRLQSERMRGALLPSAGEYFKHYGLTPEKLALAKPDAIVMHPGPMNRGIEIDSAVADGERSVILPQVTFGIAVRMAVMSILAGGWMKRPPRLTVCGEPHPAARDQPSAACGLRLVFASPRGRSALRAAARALEMNGTDVKIEIRAVG